METIRLAVRALVEFTLHGEDILRLGGKAQDMQDGTLGHKARQALLGEAWTSEVPVELNLPVEEEELALHISGRMDAFRGGDIPIIEEIKLCQGKHAPESPWPAHEAQAVCYGHMLCQAQGIGQVVIRVAYVDRRGNLRAQFDTPMTAEACRERFEALLIPYLRRLRLDL